MVGEFEGFVLGSLDGLSVGDALGVEDDIGLGYALGPWCVGLADVEGG